MTTKKLASTYRLACERYAGHGVNVEATVKKPATVAISMHCWQGEDVRGFANSGAAQEIVWGGCLGRTHIGLDYFDASINRVAA